MGGNCGRSLLYILGYIRCLYSGYIRCVNSGYIRCAYSGHIRCVYSGPQGQNTFAKHEIKNAMHPEIAPFIPGCKGKRTKDPLNTHSPQSLRKVSEKPRHKSTRTACGRGRAAPLWEETSPFYALSASISSMTKTWAQPPWRLTRHSCPGDAGPTAPQLPQPPPHSVH